MKKIIATIAIVAAASMASYGQGYITFINSTAPLTHNGVKTAGMEVSFLWNAASGQSLTIDPSNPWNTLSSLSGGWNWYGPTAIITTMGSPPPAIGNFNGGVVNIASESAGSTVSMYIVSWIGSATWATAAAAGADVGLNSAFNFTLGSSTSPGPNISTAAGFGAPNVVPVPEPTTMALAGLGGLALLAIRRRK